MFIHPSVFMGYFLFHTVCTRSVVRFFYIEASNIKKVKTSWTYGKTDWTHGISTIIVFYESRLLNYPKFVDHILFNES